MNSQLICYLEFNKHFSSSQYKFWRGLSITDAVEKLVAHIINQFDEHVNTLATLCDLTKPFDCVPHDVLIYKLERYGVSGVELSHI